MTEIGFKASRKGNVLAAIRDASSIQQEAEGFDAAGELCVGRAANRMLRGVMALERGLIRAGLPLPWGRSLLALAHKP